MIMEIKDEYIEFFLHISIPLLLLLMGIIVLMAYSGMIGINYEATSKIIEASESLIK